MPEAQTGTIEDAVSSAIETAGVQSAEGQQPPAGQPPDTDSVRSASEEAGESLTPNLRRIRESLKSDQEFHALPPEAQQAVLKRMAEADKAFHKDKATLADATRKAGIYDQLEHAGVTVEDVQSLLQAKAQGRPVAATQVREAVQDTSKTLKGLDRLLSKTDDPAQRESIRDLRDVLKEELDALVDAHPTTKALAQEVSRLRAATSANRVSKLDAEIDTLEEKYPSSLIEKYRAQMKATLAKPENAMVSARKMLTLLASDEELEEAETHQAKSTTTPAKPQGSITTATVNVPDKDLEPYKAKKGRGWDLEGIVSHLTGKVAT